MTLIFTIRRYGYSRELVFINSIVGGAIDARFLPAILKGIMARMEQGPLTGSYARDVRIIVYDGKMHPVDSNEISFMLAGRNAFSTAFKEAGPKILEPVYDVEVSVPADYLGDVMSDLQGRRATSAADRRSRKSSPAPQAGGGPLRSAPPPARRSPCSSRASTTGRPPPQTPAAAPRTAQALSGLT